MIFDFWLALKNTLSWLVIFGQKCIILFINNSIRHSNLIHFLQHLQCKH